MNKKKKILPAGEIATFCGQISLILDAGIPIHDGMETLVESCEDEKAKLAFEKLSDVVRETGSLFKAVESVGFFPDYMVNMIYIGEETGKLDDVLKSLTVYYEREDKIKKSIKAAVTYPILLIAMMAAVILLLVTKVIPIFEDIFINLGTEMSKVSRSIMNIGIVVGNAAFILIAVILAVIIISAILMKLGKGQAITSFIFKMPILKGLNKRISSGRFASVIAMMLSSGYSLEKSLEVAPTIVNDKMTKKQIDECAALVKGGMSFPEALTKISMFTGMQSRIINVGFKAGKLDSVMEKISKTYEEEIDDSIEKLVAYIEPCLVAILSLVIGGILISVMLPLASIMSSIG